MADGIHFEDAVVPDGMLLFAVGDVHGCRALLAEMHAQIETLIQQREPADWRIVHVGDYCDRGPDTKGVIDFLIARMERDRRVVCLRGNHDQGFLNFVAARRGAGIFVNNGGETTAASYGVAADFSSPEATERTRDALSRAMPDAHVDFLATLPYATAAGDFFLCHAGIRPGVALERQKPEDLTWIRETFLDDPRLHPKVIVHGHTPADTVEVRPNRINVDTRAFASGKLSALVVDGMRKSVLEVSAEPRRSRIRR